MAVTETPTQSVGSVLRTYVTRILIFLYKHSSTQLILQEISPTCTRHVEQQTVRADDQKRTRVRTRKRSSAAVDTGLSAYTQVPRHEIDDKSIVFRLVWRDEGVREPAMCKSESTRRRKWPECTSRVFGSRPVKNKRENGERRCRNELRRSRATRALGRRKCCRNDNGPDQCCQRWRKRRLFTWGEQYWTRNLNMRLSI